MTWDRGEQIAYIVTAALVAIADRRTDVPAGPAGREPAEQYADVMELRKELKRLA